MKAKTDQGPAEPNSEMPDYIRNLFLLMKLTAPTDVYETYLGNFNNCNIRYGDMKKQLAEDMINFVRPIREHAAELQKDEAAIQRILRNGAEKARASSAETIAGARKLIGINYY